MASYEDTNGTLYLTNKWERYEFKLKTTHHVHTLSHVLVQTFKETQEQNLVDIRTLISHNRDIRPDSFYVSVIFFCLNVSVIKLKHIQGKR